MIIRFFLVLFRQGNGFFRSGEACHVPGSSGFKSRTGAERGMKLAGVFRTMMPRRVKVFFAVHLSVRFWESCPERNSGKSGKTRRLMRSMKCRGTGAAALARRKQHQGKTRRFVTQGRTACRKGALIPSRSGYGIKALTTKTMPNINDNFLKLQAGYLFPEIGRRVHAFAESHPEAAKRLIRCGIGDVTEPLPMAAIEAMHLAVDDLSTHERFHGYGPEQGYFWLREAIAKKSLSGSRRACGGGRDLRV